MWVLDGSGFKQNFEIYHMLPDPKSELKPRDIVWSVPRRHMNGSNHGLFFRLSEAREERPTITKAEVRSGWIHSIVDIERELESSYNGYHQFDWVRPRQTWLDAKCPVYIDFGDEHLVKLDVYDDSGLKCIRLISKQKFVHDVMAETDALTISRPVSAQFQHKPKQFRSGPNPAADCESGFSRYLRDRDVNWLFCEEALPLGANPEDLSRRARHRRNS